jgi:hypothetical protein
MLSLCWMALTWGAFTPRLSRVWGPALESFRLGEAPNRAGVSVLGCTRRAAPRRRR